MLRLLCPVSMQVVLDPDLRMAIDVFPCEDGHAQERSLFESVLQRVKAIGNKLEKSRFCQYLFV